MKIVLLSYLNRSGSTFLVNQLSKVPEICVCPEADILYELLLSFSDFKINFHHVSKWMYLFELDPKFKTWQLPIKSIINSDIVGKSSFELFINILVTFKNLHFPESNVILYKQNYLYKVFPKMNTQTEIKLFGLSLFRDPRGIYNSQKHTINPQLGREMCGNPLQIIKEWNYYFKKSTSLTKEDNYKLIFYEEIVEQFESTMGSLLGFLGIQTTFNTYKQINTKHIEWIDENHKSMHPNIDRSPMPQNINKWRGNLNQTDVSILQLCRHNNNHYQIRNEFIINSSKFHISYIYYSYLRIQFICIQFLRKIAFWIRYI